jgi:hypothetical protein
MKVLRLATSADYYPAIPPEQRMPALIEGMFEQATGEPMETTIRVLYPSAASPGMLEDWLEEIRPDAVFIWVNPFWFAYESAPLRLRRGGGAVGRFAGRVARRASKKKWIARNPVYHVARRLAQKSLGATYYYEPEEVLAAMEAWLHVILRRETIVPAVYLPLFCLMYEPDAARLARSEARRLEVNALVAALCRRLHVICTSPGEDPDLPIGREYVEADMMHPTAPVHRWFAEKQLPAHLAAWRELRGEAIVASLPKPTIQV